MLFQTVDFDKPKVWPIYIFFFPSFSQAHNVFLDFNWHNSGVHMLTNDNNKIQKQPKA
uniref:Uncharacterized protein n=1 Tax=Anguilla anguilla TaxID=7936 RepID=A0A0E9QCS2_ANGAN